MNTKAFEQLLTGGHPNSLGRTHEVIDLVLADKSRMEELFECYSSEDEVVRLRTSNALKKLAVQKAEWFDPFINRLSMKLRGWTRHQPMDPVSNLSKS